MFELSNRSDYCVSNLKRNNFSRIIYSEDLYIYFIHISINRNLRTFDYIPDSWQSVTGLHPSSPQVVGPLTADMFHRNSFLLPFYGGDL
jgi:hypothetical protein